MSNPLEGQLERMWQAIQDRRLDALSADMHAIAERERLNPEYRESQLRPLYEMEADAAGIRAYGPL